MLIVLYVGSQLRRAADVVDGRPNQRLIMLALPFVFVIFVSGFPAGLLVYWITTNIWTVGQQYVIRRAAGCPARARRERPDGRAAGGGRGQPTGEAAARRPEPSAKDAEGQPTASAQRRRGATRRAARPPDEPLRRRRRRQPRKKKAGRRTMSSTSRRARSARCSRRSVTALGLEATVEVDGGRRRRDRARSTATTSGCSSAATGRRSTPSSTWPSGRLTRGAGRPRRARGRRRRGLPRAPRGGARSARPTRPSRTRASGARWRWTP